jgi:hypothetical protein
VLVGNVPAQTFFFSSTGGRTQNSEDVWSSKVSYLRSVDDRWSVDRKNNPSNASWGPRVRTQQQVAAAFGLADVVRIDLSDRYASGAVRLAKAWSSRGTYAELAGIRLVTRLSLTSRWYRQTGAPTPVVIPKAFAVSLTGVRVKLGKTAAMTGTVLPANRSAGSVITLGRWDDKKRTWVQVGRTKVGPSGTFAFAVSGRTPEVRRYAVYKAPASCGKSCVIRGTSSKAAIVAIFDDYKVTAAASATLVRAGKTVAVRGQVVPARQVRDARVAIQRYDRVRGWVGAGTGRIDKSGRFTASLTTLPPGRHQLSVAKLSERCIGASCAMSAGRSTVMPITVQLPYAVKVSAVTKARGAVTVRGLVTPTNGIAGGKVVIQRMVAGQWGPLGVTRVSKDGRFVATFTGLTSRPTALRVTTSASACLAAVCVHPAGNSPVVVVTPRSK